jgi:hypothetical protein
VLISDLALDGAKEGDWKGTGRERLSGTTKKPRKDPGLG